MIYTTKKEHGDKPHALNSTRRVQARKRGKASKRVEQ
jgi:hypothetical protein